MQNILQTNQLFYEKAIKEHGISAQGVHWINKSSQYKRFEILHKFIKKYIKNASIVDAGCGFGEFYNYLLEKNIKVKKYIGLDCYYEMIKKSKKRFPDQCFMEVDILNDTLPIADYYLASGSLNILNKDQFYLFIKRCFEASNKGFAFNFLKKRSFNNIKIEEVMSYCSSLSDTIKTKNDYLDNDFSILMMK